MLWQHKAILVEPWVVFMWNSVSQNNHSVRKTFTMLPMHVKKVWLGVYNIWWCQVTKQVIKKLDRAFGMIEWYGRIWVWCSLSSKRSHITCMNIRATRRSFSQLGCAKNEARARPIFCGRKRLRAAQIFVCIVQERLLHRLGMVQSLLVTSAGFSEINSHFHGFSTFCTIMHLGPVSQRSRKVLKPGYIVIVKSQILWLLSCFIYTFLIWPEASFMQNVSGVFICLFSELQAPPKFLAFEKEAPGQWTKGWLTARPIYGTALELYW